jgi:hypothetical protein
MPDYTDRLKMPQSAVDALVKAVGDDLVRSIVADHYKGGRVRVVSGGPLGPALRPAR